MKSRNRNQRGQKVAISSLVAVVVLAGVAWWLAGDQFLFALSFESLGRNAQGYPEYRHRQSGIVFVSLPGGTFEMGSTADEFHQATELHWFGSAVSSSDPKAVVMEKARRQMKIRGRTVGESPRHRVTVGPFLIAKHEVTQAEWAAVMASDSPVPRGALFPVVVAEWEEAREFCVKAGLALPTEAEWEYACRAGSTGDFAGTGDPEEMGWCGGKEQPQPVGKKRPNGFGLHDMHGNVAEWCQDLFQKDFYAQSEGAIDPLCENSASRRRVIRGGDSKGSPFFCRSACRQVGGSLEMDFIGLRPVYRLR